MSQDVPEIFEMPLTFATADFEEFVRELKPHLLKIQAAEESERQTRVDKMCEFYAKLLAEMSPSVRTIRFQYDNNLHYKYDMRACRTAHGKLKDSEEYKEETDEWVLRPAWNHLDGYVWSILKECHDLCVSAFWRMGHENQDLIHNFNTFLQKMTARLNTTKKDITSYIYLIENRAKNPRFCTLSELWDLQTMIMFTKSDPPLVCARNWYMKYFTFALPSGGGPVEGGKHLTFAKRNAHITCDNIGSLLTRLEKW
jgi:hypothetical protein